ncbi:hypothetical protein AB7M32_003601 [Pseudomonas sp. R151218B TE3479]
MAIRPIPATDYNVGNICLRDRASNAISVLECIDHCPQNSVPLSNLSHTRSVVRRSVNTPSSLQEFNAPREGYQSHADRKYKRHAAAVNNILDK